MESIAEGARLECRRHDPHVVQAWDVRDVSAAGKVRAPQARGAITAGARCERRRLEVRAPEA